MQTTAPPIPVLIPESAPFSAEQRTWLNGFFAGLLSLDGGVNALSPEETAKILGDVAGKPAARGPLDDGDDGSTPWHDMSMPLADRMGLATGRPLRRRMMAAMAQQDCGQCGYTCEDYANAICSEKEERLNLCVPGGKETARMLKIALCRVRRHAGRGQSSRASGRCASARGGRNSGGDARPITRQSRRDFLPLAHQAQQARLGQGDLAHRFRSHRFAARLRRRRLASAFFRATIPPGRCSHRRARMRRRSFRSAGARCARS